MATKIEKAESIERLLEWITPNDTIYTITRHRSASGMLHVLQVLVIHDNEPRYLGYNVANALDLTYDRKNEGVKMTGCGYDKGHDIAYNLGLVLFNDGRALKHRGL